MTSFHNVDASPSRKVVKLCRYGSKAMPSHVSQKIFCFKKVYPCPTDYRGGLQWLCMVVCTLRFQSPTGIRGLQDRRATKYNTEDAEKALSWLWRRKCDGVAVNLDTGQDRPERPGTTMGNYSSTVFQETTQGNFTSDWLSRGFPASTDCIDSTWLKTWRTGLMWLKDSWKWMGYLPSHLLYVIFYICPRNVQVFWGTDYALRKTYLL